MPSDLSKHIPVVGALFLALSIVYDFAYIHALGLSFAQVPTTLSDHVRTAVIWSPGLALSLFGLIAGLGSRPLAMAERCRHPVHRAVDLVVLFGLGPLLLALSFFGRPEELVIAASLIIGMVLLRFQPGAGNIDARLGPGTAPNLFFFSAILAVVAWIGWIQGTALVTSTAPLAEVTIKQGGVERVVNATGLRRFSEASVLVDSTAVEVLPSDAIVRVRFHRPSQVSIACKLSKRLCPPTK